MERINGYELREEIPTEIREELREYSDMVAHLLYHRGIVNKEDANTFFNFTYDKNILDPFLLHNMDKAVERILSAIKNKEKIVIYSDYDADGIPGAVILNDFLRKIGHENYSVYIPHRNKEGFGLNKNALQKIKEENEKEKSILLITIDCGITDVEEIELANSLGVDVIITDHHEELSNLPNAYAIVNPKQKACNYPEKVLCGSGVIFKVVQALVAKGDFDLPNGWEKTLLDMIAIATLSDMVPLIGENRALASFGMTVLKMSPRKGLHKLFRKTNTFQKTLVEDDIGFTISPRINAASRMGEPETAFKMLSTLDEVEAGALVDQLHHINDQRKGHVAAMVKEIHKNISLDKNVIVMGNLNWKPSLLGLAASKMVDEYNKPTFLWGRGEGTSIKGSCRAPKGTSVVDTMKSVSKYILETFGGHAQAGGFVVTTEGVDLLNDALNDSYEKLQEDIKSGDKKVEPNWIDYQLSISDINNSMFREIQKLSPFGIDNHKPVFIFKNAKIDSIDHFGKEKNHLKLGFNKEEDGNQKIFAIAFFQTSDSDSWKRKFKEGDDIDLVAHIEKENFGRNNGLRLRIIDVL